MSCSSSARSAPRTRTPRRRSTRSARSTATPGSGRTSPASTRPTRRRGSSRRSTRRFSRRESTSGATSRGRSSTTSSGPRGTPGASGSCGWTSTPSAAPPRPAPTGTGGGPPANCRTAERVKAGAGRKAIREQPKGGVLVGTHPMPATFHEIHHPSYIDLWNEAFIETHDIREIHHGSDALAVHAFEFVHYPEQFPLHDGDAAVLFGHTGSSTFTKQALARLVGDHVDLGDQRAHVDRLGVGRRDVTIERGWQRGGPRRGRRRHWGPTGRRSRRRARRLRWPR